MDETTNEDEDEENICFSARDLSQIRNAIFDLLNNFLRLLPKFSLKEKPQCIQNCVEVNKYSRNLGVASMARDDG